jgi:cytochrome P450
VQYTIPELRKVWKCISIGERLLAPILAERERLDSRLDEKKPDDPLEWLRGHMNPADRNDTRLHSISQLNFGALSVNTTSQTLTNCIFNLATYPEYLDVLREEVQEVLAEIGGVWTLDSMSKLKKMDSFIKETLRHSGHLTGKYSSSTIFVFEIQVLIRTATFQRQALRPIRLSDGTQISPGTYTFAPANAINFDPNIYPSPEIFDGMRFYKLRRASVDDEKKHQLTSITKTELQFGSGRHACSGRWFASHEIKLVLARLVAEYEINLKNGESRPKSILYQTNQLPDPKAEVLFRKRK